MKIFTYHRVTLVFLLLYAVWRFGFNLYSLSGECVDNPDAFTKGGESATYSALAVSMAERGEYNLGVGERPFTRITPGYPFILWLNMLLFGKRWIFTLFMLQTLCAVASVFLTYKICFHLRGHGTGLLAGFLVASYAPLHYLCLIIYREPITFAILALYLFLIRPQAYRPKSSYIEFGLLIGVAAIIREEQLLLLVPATILIFWKECEIGRYLPVSFRNLKSLLKSFSPFSEPRLLRRALWKTAVMAVLVPVVFAPWIIRNALTLHRLEMMSSNGGVHLYLGNSDEFDPAKPLDYGIYSRIPELETMSENEVNKLYLRKALKYIVDHPARIAENAWFKMRMLFTPSIRHMDDFPFILLAILAGAFVLGFFGECSEPKRHAVFAGMLVFAFIIEKGFSYALFFPTVEFAVIPYLGLAGAAWMLFKREQPLYVLTYLLLLAVNIVFVPQHRQRWMMDLLTIIWTAVLLHDVSVYLQSRFSRSPSDDSSNEEGVPK